MYNILFASLPIVWYCVQDFEKDKQSFLSNAKLYRIGLRHKLFGTIVFWQWFLYGALQALILLLVCFKFQQWNALPNG